ncbi:uncharacterized protein QYS62_011461 [Fusarium acuminatum]|uniref:Uncharacterized protein n=1 Tax=Fusarium acuminatum TaxID=5515 RepID=A0ABZ2XAR3_9HYPO
MPRAMQSKLSPKKPRSRVKDGPAFVFVNTTDASDAKTIVRRHAARSGLIRRHENTTTLPDSRELIPAAMRAPGATSPTKNRHGMYKGNTLCDALNLGSVPQPLSSRYETFRLSYNFDITDLTSFTDVDLVTNAYRLLQGEPNRLISLLQKQYSSFLFYLPTRYGSSTCLDDAMHCVAARAGQMLGFQMPKSMPYILYGKALKSLQIAISDGAECTESDIYCVTRLLVLYEIIDEMYRKESSIFEAQEWQRVFQCASVLQSDSDCHLWWKFFGIIGFVPGILKDLRNLLEDSTNRSGYLVGGSAILERAKSVHKALHNEHVLYQHTAPHPQSLFSLPTAAESPDRIRLRVFYLYTIMYICRVLATLSSTEIERATSEVEAQMFASQALLIEEVATKLDPAMAWHLQQRNGLAKSIIEKKEEWFFDNEIGISRDKLKGFLTQRWLTWENSWRAIHYESALFQ